MSLFFRNLFLFSCFYTVSYMPFAFSCLSAFSSPGEVFIAFAKKNGKSYRESFGSVWEQKITNSLIKRKWTTTDAQSFLTEMKNRIGVEDTLKMIKLSSYFNMMTYQGFKNRVYFYERYIGFEGVTHRLRKTLGGFHIGNVGEIKLVIAYLEQYIGGKEEAKLATQEIMKNNLQAFTTAKLSELEKVVRLMSALIGKEKVIKEIQKSLYTFSLIKLKNIQQWTKDIGKIRTTLKTHSLHHFLQLQSNSLSPSY